MTSSNGNIFRVTGHLCGEFTGPGEFPTQRPVTRSFDIFFDLCPNKRLSKHWWGWWFETQSCPLWRHRNDMPIVDGCSHQFCRETLMQFRSPSKDSFELTWLIRPCGFDHLFIFLFVSERKKRIQGIFTRTTARNKLPHFRKCAWPIYHYCCGTAALYTQKWTA